MQFVSDAKEKIAELNLDTKRVKYSDKIKKYRDINKISGDEELVRAFLLSRLVNELGYTADRIELEKEYPAGRKPVMTPRIDVIVRDKEGKAFLFIECKAPAKFESDKQRILRRNQRPDFLFFARRLFQKRFHNANRLFLCSFGRRVDARVSDFSPEHIFYYAYTVFHSPTYRDC